VTDDRHTDRPRYGCVAIGGIATDVGLGGTSVHRLLGDAASRRSLEAEARRLTFVLHAR